MLIFLDESGNHNLDVTKFDNIYNIFVLWGICFSEESYKIFDTKFRALKKNFFWNEEYILHTVEITRPSKAKDSLTKQFNNSKFRTAFYEAMNLLIAESDFSLIVCAIKKEQLVQKYHYPEDPYHFAFDNIMNRSLRKVRGWCIRIFPENRDNTEDRKLEIRLLEMKVSGTYFYRGSEIAKQVEEFRFVRKWENQSGSQLADLLVTPIWRHLIWKSPRPWHEISYEVIKQKITRSDDFTIFP